MPSKTVNHPTDPREKEQDVNDKFQLFGIYHAFKSGKLPSNKQCDIALNSALASNFLSSPPEELSDQGKIFVRDLRNVIEQTKKLFLSKNEGNVLQEFLWAAGRSAKQETKNPEVPLDKEIADKDAKRALDGLKTLGNLVITNGEFRKLLSDATTLLRDIAGDISQEAVNKARPPEEQVAQVDQPEDENVWLEKPDMPKKKEKLQAKAKKKTKKSKTSAVESSGEAAKGSEHLATDSQAAGTSAPTGTERPADRTVASKTKDYLSEKVPQERRDQFAWRLRKVVDEIQGRGDYYQAIDTLLSLAEQYVGHTKDITQKSTQAARDVTSTNSVKAAKVNLRILIERFANGTSLDDFFESLNNIYRDADQDPILKGWYKQMDVYIRKCLEEQGFITRQESKSEWNGLYDQGRFLLRERYRGHTNRIIEEIKFLADQFNEDPQNKAFAESLRKLATDLGGDKRRRLTITKELYKDLMDVILPNVFENVRYIPISRIEVADPMIDVVVENLVIESDNLMPNVFELDTDNYLRWGRKTIANRRDNKIMIALSGIQADFRDVSYFIKKKHGFPSLTDVGVMDILLGGEGFGFKINASNAQADDGGHFFVIDNVSVKIRNFGIKVKKSKHRILFAVFKSVLYRAVRPALERVLEGKIRELFTKGDAFAYEVHTEAKRAQEAPRTEGETAPNTYSRYLDAVRYRLAERKKQAEAEAEADTFARHSEVNVAATDENLIFPDIRLPHSLSEKATWYHDLAARGDRWESPIFTIGKARESVDIPKSSSIARKSHETADDRLKGKQQAPNGDTRANGHDKADKPKERPITELDGGPSADGGVGTKSTAAPRTSTEIRRVSLVAVGRGNASGD